MASLNMLNEARTFAGGESNVSPEEQREVLKEQLAKQRKIGLVWMFSGLVGLIYYIISRGGVDRLNLDLESYKADTWRLLFGTYTPEEEAMHARIKEIGLDAAMEEKKSLGEDHTEL